MIKYTKAIAANTDLLTAQAFITTQEGVGLVTIICARGEDIFTKVRQIASDEQSLFWEMEEALSKRLTIYLSSLKAKISPAEDLQILVAAWKEALEDDSNKGASLYIESLPLSPETQLSPTRVYLYRGNQASKLVSDQETGQLVSGYLKQGDTLLFATATLTNNLDETQILSLMQQSDDLEENLDAFLLEHSKTDPVAAVLLSVPHVSLGPTEDPEFELLPDLLPDTPYSKPKINFSIKSFLSNALQVIKRLTQTKKAKMSLAGLVAIIFIIGLSAYYLNLKQGQSSDQINQILSDAKQNYQQAQNLKDTNPDEAKAALERANQKLSQALSQNPTNPEAQTLKKEIEANSKAILKQNEITDWPVFLKLDLIKSGFSSKKISLSADNLLLFDQSQKTLVSLNIENKSNKILAGKTQLGDAAYFALNGDFAFTFSPDKGIVRTELPTQKSSQVVKPDNEWGSIEEIYGFGSNIYLIDTSKNQIWKYVPVVSGYSDRSSYLKDSINLSGFKKIHIDASVWILKIGGEIVKLTNGTIDHFAIQGLDQPLNSADSFFISSDTENIYFLDNSNSRLVILKKDGKYNSQMSGEKFATATDFVVDEQRKKIYLLENNVIYQLDIK